MVLNAPDGFEKCYSSVVSVGRKLHIQMILQRKQWGTGKSGKCRNWLVPDGGYRIDIPAAVAGHLPCPA